MRRLLSLVLALLFTLSIAGPALGAQRGGGPHPQPPKCVPANTPGCS
jgi:hypothetical protein